jgi:hypothetical protein
MTFCATSGVVCIVSAACCFSRAFITARKGERKDIEIIKALGKQPKTATFPGS